MEIPLQVFQYSYSTTVPVVASVKGLNTKCYTSPQHQQHWCCSRRHFYMFLKKLPEWAYGSGKLDSWQLGFDGLIDFWYQLHLYHFLVISSCCSGSLNTGCTSRNTTGGHFSHWQPYHTAGNKVVLANDKWSRPEQIIFPIFSLNLGCFPG